MSSNNIGRYEIIEELGRGGMATVFRAIDPRFGREVALKVLPQHYLHDLTFRARFEREAQTIASLEHPAIVSVYDFGHEDDQPFLVMRLMHGGSLVDRIKTGTIPMQQAAEIFSRLAPALDYAHDRAIIHRDLKPQNILFDRWEKPYLADFGIVKLVEESVTDLTASGGAVGTPAYMSPEQVSGIDELDGRSDMYSLGVILFEMLTGMLPYEARTPMSLALKHITEPVPNILEFNRSLPAQSQLLIDRAMAKDREERYLTTSALAEAISELAKIEPGPLFVQPVAPIPVAPTPISLDSVVELDEESEETQPADAVNNVEIAAAAAVIKSVSPDTPTELEQAPVVPLPEEDIAGLEVGVVPFDKTDTPTELDRVADNQPSTGREDTKQAIIAAAIVAENAHQWEKVIEQYDHLIKEWSDDPLYSQWQAAQAKAQRQLNSDSGFPVQRILLVAVGLVAVIVSCLLIAYYQALFPFTSTTSAVASPTLTNTHTQEPSTRTLKPTETIEIVALLLSPTGTPTLEPTHTATASPTVSLTPTLQPQVPLFRILYSSVNLRNGPGAQYDAVGFLYEGDLVDVIGKTSGGNWFNIILPGGEPAWISSTVGELIDESDQLSIPIAATIPPLPERQPTTTPEVTATVVPYGANFTWIDPFQTAEQQRQLANVRVLEPVALWASMIVLVAWLYWGFKAHVSATNLFSKWQLLKRLTQLMAETLLAILLLWFFFSVG